MRSNTPWKAFLEPKRYKNRCSIRKTSPKFSVVPNTQNFRRGKKFNRVCALMQDSTNISQWARTFCVALHWKKPQKHRHSTSYVWRAAGCEHRREKTRELKVSRARYAWMISLSRSEKSRTIEKFRTDV